MLIPFLWKFLKDRFEEDSGSFYGATIAVYRLDIQFSFSFFSSLIIIKIHIHRYEIKRDTPALLHSLTYIITLFYYILCVSFGLFLFSTTQCFNDDYVIYFWLHAGKNVGLEADCGISRWLRCFGHGYLLHRQ